MNRRTFLQEAARACAGIMAGRASTLAGVRSSGKPLVVDTYSACVELDAVRRGGIDIAIQALTAEEMLVRIPPEPDSAPIALVLETSRTTQTIVDKSLAKAGIIAVCVNSEVEAKNDGSQTLVEN